MSTNDHSPSQSERPSRPRDAESAYPGMMNRGMTLWDVYAAAALQGILASTPEANYRDAATDASEYADALLRERDRRDWPESQQGEQQ